MITASVMKKLRYETKLGQDPEIWIVVQARESRDAQIPFKIEKT